MKRYLGVDLHRTQVYLVHAVGERKNISACVAVKELKMFAQQLCKDDEIAVESASNTQLFHDAVITLVARVVVVNPSQFKVITQSVKKTARNDAETLTLYPSKGLLPEVRMKDKQHRNTAHLAQTRDLLVKERSALKAKINNLLSAERDQPEKRISVCITVITGIGLPDESSYSVGLADIGSSC